MCNNRHDHFYNKHTQQLFILYSLLFQQGVSYQTAFPVFQLLEHYLKVLFRAGDITVTSLCNDLAIHTAVQKQIGSLKLARIESGCKMTHPEFQNRRLSRVSKTWGLKQNKAFNWTPTQVIFVARILASDNLYIERIENQCSKYRFKRGKCQNLTVYAR